MPLVTSSPYRGIPPWSMFDGTSIGPRQTLVTGLTSNLAQRLEVAVLSPTKFVIVYNDLNSGLWAQASEVSGTTITPGTAVQFQTGTTASNQTIVPLDSTRFLVSWKSASSGGVRARVGSVSGTSITFPGSTVLPHSFNGSNVRTSAMSVIGTDEVLWIGNNQSPFTEATIRKLSMSGTTINLGESTTFVPHGSYRLSGTGDVMQTLSSDLTLLVFVGQGGSLPSNLIGIDLSSGSPFASPGTKVELASSSKAFEVEEAAALSSSTGFVMWGEPSGPNARLESAIASHTGNGNFSMGTTFTIKSSNAGFASAVKVADGLILTAYRDLTGGSKLRMLNYSGTTLGYETAEIVLDTTSVFRGMRLGVLDSNTTVAVWNNNNDDHISARVIEDS